MHCPVACHPLRRITSSVMKAEISAMRRPSATATTRLMARGLSGTIQPRIDWSSS